MADIDNQIAALSDAIAQGATRICRDIATRNGLDYANFANLSGQARRAAMMDALVEREASAPTDSNISTDVHMNTLPSQSRIAVMGEALFHRISPSHVPSERSREFVGLTIPEMARRVLEGSGHRTVGFSSSMLVERALHSTSDFPLILGDTVGRVLREAYGAAPSGIKQVARKTTARDFRAKRSLTFSEAPRLEKVRRRRYEGWDTVVPFDEILVVSKEAIDLTRLNAGAPVVDSHVVGTTLAQVAVVEKAWIEGQEGKATVRFPAIGIDERADRMFAMVADGIIKNISVGYSIDELTIEQPKGKGAVERHTATRWTPHEISFVTVGADPGAQVRTASEASYPIHISSTMPSLIAARMRMRMASLGL